MKQVRDPDLKRDIFKIICLLFNNNKEIASKIMFTLCEDYLPIGCLKIFTEKKYVIEISTRAKKMLKSEEGRAIICAIIAHEIGHLLFMEETNFYFEHSLDFKTKAEVEADKIALILLGRICSNPKELLLRQIDWALNATLSCENVTQDEITLAEMFVKERKKNLVIA